MAKSKHKKIRVTFNAPVTLSFVFISAIILVLNLLTKGSIVQTLFSSAGGRASQNPFNFSSPLSYLRLFLHIFGEAGTFTGGNFTLISNFILILLLGPGLEEKYGSAILVLMMTVTSLVSGVVNACVGNTMLIGASDIVLMMILLSAFTSISKNEIPLSFLLITLLYLIREIMGIVNGSGISPFSNIAGGICGSLFAFLATPKSSSRVKSISSSGGSTGGSGSSGSKSSRGGKKGKSEDKDFSEREDGKEKKVPFWKKNKGKEESASEDKTQYSDGSDYSNSNYGYSDNYYESSGSDRNDSYPPYGSSYGSSNGSSNPDDESTIVGSIDI